MDRRTFIKQGLALATIGGLALPGCFSESAFARELPEFNLEAGQRTLDIYRPESRERLSLAYLQDGSWVDDAYTQICWLLRDVKAQQHVQMDVQLIAILDWTQQFLAKYDYKEPIHILSGYRTLATNTRTEGSSKDSKHMLGKAIDFTVPGLPVEYLGKLMTWLSQGGVGVYHHNGFVHVDTGRVRFWRR